MPTIAQTNPFANLPIAELDASLHEFARPVTDLLPDARLGAVAELMTRGIVTSQSPLITQIARGAIPPEATIWPTCQRAYRFLSNPRCTSRLLRKGLYRVAQAAVAALQPAYLVIAIDPVNFEKPYTYELEGIDRVIKSTPPSLDHAQRVTRGYPAITATVVNLPQPATTYAQWFSTRSAEYISLNREIERSLRTSRALFPRAKLRFVGDAGLDDQKIFAQVARVQGEFVIRACRNRHIEVYNPHRNRWEQEALFDLVETVAFEFEQEVEFTHARKMRRVRKGFGWFQIRLGERQQELWVLVAHDFELNPNLILLTNVPLDGADSVRQVYADWRQRSYIEHGYRFEQEQGLDVEDVRVETLERMRRLFILVLLAAQFVFYIGRVWVPPAVRWLRILGGKLGLKQDLDGPYILMRGISAVWQTVSTLQFALAHPFPAQMRRCE